MRALLFATVTLLMLTHAQAMDISLRIPMPLIVSSDMIIDDNGEEVMITGPWVIQTLNIMNDHSEYTLVIKEITATASCLEDTWGYSAEIYAEFDPNDMHVEIPVGGSSFDTGKMYFYDLTADCKKGHLVRVDVEGELVDAQGEYVDRESGSTAFITRP